MAGYAVLQGVLNWLGGGVIKQFTDPLIKMYEAKLAAQNDEQKLQLQRDIDAMTAARDIAVADLAQRWSATALGRWLVVVPFGVWWAAIFLVQIVNPWFGWHLVVVAVPPDIMEMAKVLVPAIIIGDAGTFVARQIRR
jgi:hypothetical protein